jgi:MYXO-CTERM domain-containing protein
MGDPDAVFQYLYGMPVSEADIWAMLPALGLVGFAARRRGCFNAGR